MSTTTEADLDVPIDDGFRPLRVAAIEHDQRNRPTATPSMAKDTRSVVWAMPSSGSRARRTLPSAKAVHEQVVVVHVQT